MIFEDLKRHLDQSLPHHQSSEVYHYTVLNAGKLFRPKLVWAIYQDLNASTSKENHSLLSSAVEIHHAYTLMHDDLPCMDNDDTRRGKPSAHVQFSEWEALLAGDGLQNASFRLLSRMDSKESLNIIRLFSHFTGPKGLILGQAMDLSGDMKKNFENIVTTHTLKTARLIQASLVCSALLTEKADVKTLKNLYKFGQALGVTFQLLDDFEELNRDINTHEGEINPWVHFEDLAFSTLKKELNILSNFFKSHDFKNLKEMMSDYIEKNKELNKNNESSIPVMSLLNSFSL